MITSDREKLFIILYNLIENALKFTEKGLVEFGADVENERTLKFFVKDTGIGISKENIDYIFDKFRKIESDRSVLYRGLGLGLNITKSLITHMNGNISVESEEGKGSCFRFQMNVSKMTVRDYQDMDTNSGNLKIPDLSGKKILIAEDEKLNMIFLESFLQKSGAFIFTSTNGQETLEIFNIYNDIDLILMDIKMPVMDGVEAAKEIRMIFSDHKVKMIAQTAYTGEYQKERILNAGFDDYIEKPIDLYYMMQLIKKHLNIL
jgi:CheY-like chemotaxis protein